MFFISFRRVMLWMLSAVMLLLWQTAFAGPILNRIMERRMAQQQDVIADESGVSRQVSLPAGARIVRDFQYGTDKRQRMDIYLPWQAVGAPVIFMVHGGGWRIGDKGMKSVVENKMNRWVPKGLIFISVNYRMVPDADPIEQENDIARALAAAQGKAATLGGDPTKFILMGHSAGAHLVALLAASPATAYKLGAGPWIGAISLDSGAIDVIQIMQTRHFSLFDQAFGSDAAYWKKASPYHELTAQATPFLVVCLAQRRVSCPQARKFVDRAVSLHVRASVLEQNLSHKDINQQLGLEGSYTDAVESFMGSLDSSVMRILKDRRIP